MQSTQHQSATKPFLSRQSAPPPSCWLQAPWIAGAAGK